MREAYDVLSDEAKRQAYDAAQGFLPPDAPVLPFPPPHLARAEAELPRSWPAPTSDASARRAGSRCATSRR